MMSTIPNQIYSAIVVDAILFSRSLSAWSIGTLSPFLKEFIRWGPITGFPLFYQTEDPHFFSS